MVNQGAFRKILFQQFGPRNAEAILASQRKRLIQLHRGRTKYADRALRAHLNGNILPGLSLYQALCDRGVDQTEALRVTKVALEESVHLRRRLMSWLGRLRIAFPVLRSMIRKTMQNDYPPEGWETRWVEVSSKLVAFDIQRCFYLDTLTAYGAPELTACFCALDDLLYQDLWPDVKWGRTMTLGRGDPVCNFRYKKS